MLSRVVLGVFLASGILFACRGSKATEPYTFGQEAELVENNNNSGDQSAEVTVENLSQPIKSDLDLRAEALAILETSCSSCHNPNNAQGGFGTIENVEDMIASQIYIVPRDPEKSLLFTRLGPGGNMPPSAPLDKASVEIIRKWIAGLEISKNKPLSENEVLGLVRRDLENNVTAGLKPSTRYLSFHIPSNLGISSEGLQDLRLSMLKVINSLSRSPALVKPLAIDPQKLVYRLKLDELGISPSLFDAVMADYYPFSQRFIRLGEEKGARQAAEDHTFLRTETGTDNFVLRADWFMATATLPEPYARLLNLGAEQASLDAQLGVNILQNIADKKVMRAGFKNSNVSTQNRIIERHSQANGLAYWISYDFVSNEGVNNIFSLPLGPVGAGFDARAFQHDGGEIIFQLPNGLFGFYLSNAEGVALDKGPTSIVKQNSAPAQFLTAIVNGISCMSCHHQGLIAKADELRPFFQSNGGGFSSAELSQLFNLYPDNAAMKEAMGKDNAFYLRANKDLGIDVTKPDPLNQAYRYYNRGLTRADVREELGISDASLNSLMTLEPFRSQWTSLLQLGGFIKREEFNLLLGSAYRTVKPQVEPIEPLAGDLLMTPSCMFADTLQTDNCLIRKPVPPPPPPADPNAQASLLFYP